jgi:hypothetical protein
MKAFLFKSIVAVLLGVLAAVSVRHGIGRSLGGRRKVSARESRGQFKHNHQYEDMVCVLCSQ